MHVLRKSFQAVDKLSELAGKLFSWFLVLLMLEIVYEVVARYGFRSPTMWSYDATYMFSSIVIVMGFAWTLRDRGHVRVDIVYSLLPERVRAFLDVILTPLLFFLLFYVGLKGMLGDVLYSWKIGELAAASSLRPPVYPFKTIIFTGMSLMLLQGIVEWLRDIVVLIGGERP